MSVRLRGFATPAAVIASTAAALVASAALQRSATSLRSEQAALSKTQASLLLDGLHLFADNAALHASGRGPFRWTLITRLGAAEVVAEPEAPKLSMDRLDQAPERVFKRLGVSRAEAAAAIGSEFEPTLSRPCLRSLFSSYGEASGFSVPTPSAPSPGDGQLRAGQVWRIRVQLSSGWADDRIVRFVSSADRLTDIIERHFSKTSNSEAKCDQILADIARDL